MFSFFKVLSRPVRHTSWWLGRVISVLISNADLNTIMVNFDQCIGDGKINLREHTPFFHQIVKRRRGQRVIASSLQISYNDAEALYSVLGSALKDARRRRTKARQNLYLSELIERYIISTFMRNSEELLKDLPKG